MQAKKTCEVILPLPASKPLLYQPYARKPTPGIIRQPNFGHVRLILSDGRKDWTRADLRAMRARNGVGRPPRKDAA